MVIQVSLFFLVNFRKVFLYTQLVVILKAELRNRLSNEQT